jgi:UDP-GlcNAc:undecaprenyl-phosphate/decaprenyl-phosphate GlcNAc-1-phosphate transferase
VLTINIAVFAVATILAWGSLPFLVQVLRHFSVLDQSNERSSHTGIVPRGAGLAVGFGCLVAVQISPTSTQLQVSSAACLTLGLLGFADDVRSLSPRVRLATQLLVGALVAITFSTKFLTVSVAPLLFGVIAALWIPTYVNAFNFMDGINGMSAAQAVVAGLWYAYLGNKSSFGDLEVLGLALAGSSLGFLPHNFPRARVFLGDAGSYFLGTGIALCVVFGAARGLSSVQLLAPTLLYLADTGVTLARRAIAGKPLMQAHQDHFYQRLALGVSHAAATGAYFLATALLCFATVLNQ